MADNEPIHEPAPSSGDSGAGSGGFAVVPPRDVETGTGSQPGSAIHEITEALRASEEKYQRLRELASQLAHQLGQPMCAILANTNACLKMLQKESDTNSELIEALKDVQSQAERARGVTDRIRDFARKNEPRRDRVDVRRIIDNSLGLLQTEFVRRNVDVRLELPHDIDEKNGSLCVLADAVLVEQVFVNLLRNAVDAMEDLDTTIRLLTIRVDPGAGDELEVSVADNGKGVPAEIRKKIFDPFHSTKPNGLGIGLSLGRSIIRSHNGRMWLEAGCDGGAVFHFTLPRA
jgi:signal transduction histidine kinase